MKRRLVRALGIVICLIPARARGESFAVTLRPSSEVPGFGDPRGSGFGLLTFNGTTISYKLFVDGIPSPTLGYIQSGGEGTSGPPLVSFGFAGSVMPFDGGVATGTVATTQANLDQIRANPSGFYVNVLTAEHPGGALRGQLAPPPTSRVHFPTVVKAQGLNNTNYVTDLSLLNRGDAASVTLDYFASTPDGLGAPSASRTLAVAPGEQLVVKDLLGSLLDTSGDGALRVTAPLSVLATARVFNDQRAAGGGTTGLLVPPSEVTELAASGVLPFLSSASASETANGIGYRTNIGYFNPYADTVLATFRAVRTSDGAVLGSADRSIPGLSRVQFRVFDLIPTVPEADRVQPDFYVTFTAASGGALFVYAAVVDNKTGDGIYIKAAPSVAANEPAPAPPGRLSGTWKGGGDTFDMTWYLEEHGENVVGILRVVGTTFTGTEVLEGTLTGSSVTLTSTGLEGDISKPGCVDVVTLTGTLSGTTIQGRGRASGGTCFTGVSASFTMTKQ
jgi:CHRD domain-containing protein